MSSRTHREDMVFSHPFRLRGWSVAQPAGTYAVETEEELIEGVSFPAYRRVSTTITRAALPGACLQVIPVDPMDLAMAHTKDHAPVGTAASGIGTLLVPATRP